MKLKEQIHHPLLLHQQHQSLDHHLINKVNHHLASRAHHNKQLPHNQNKLNLPHQEESLLNRSRVEKEVNHLNPVVQDSSYHQDKVVKRVWLA